MRGIGTCALAAVALLGCGGDVAGPGGETPDAAAAATADAPDPGADARPPFPAPALDDCVTDGTAGEHAFDCDGLTYDVSLPEQCLERACGLIVDVHGYTMSAAMEDANTRMRALGRERDYVVVQPNADPDPPYSDWAASDDAQVLAFVERVAAAYHVDPDRWYFTGFSQGGFMSWRFVCKYADRFAAIAPAAGCSAGGLNACVLDQAASLPGETHILYMHGTRDTVVSASCIAPQREAVVNAYAMQNPQVLAEDDDFTWTRWTNPRGITFELIEHDYAKYAGIPQGHCFPGSDDPGDQPGQITSFACDDAAAFDWGTVAVEFFDAHVRE